MIPPLLQLPKRSCYVFLGRRTQVVKGEVCKTSMQRFESARRLHIFDDSLLLRALQQRLQLSGCIKATDVIKTADRMALDKNLRHRFSA
jgi:hypothetical protein